MISIIIPVKNDEHILKEMFDDYAGQTFQNFEIITVVDSMSSDNSIDICNDFADVVHVIEGKKAGRDMATCALMRNYGASQSNSDILIHNDCDISFQDNGQLERIVSYFVDNNLDIASTRRLLERGGLLSGLKLNADLIGEAYRKFHPITVVPIVVRKEIFNRLGGFPPSLHHDVGLDSVARKYGFNPVLIPESVIHKRMFDGVAFL